MRDNPWPPKTGHPSEMQAGIDYADGLDRSVIHDGHGRIMTEAYANRLKGSPERGREQATLGHVFKAQGELVERLRGLDDTVAMLHARMIGDMPESPTDGLERETRNVIENLVAGTLTHIDLVQRIERRVADLVKVLT